MSKEMPCRLCDASGVERIHDETSLNVNYEEHQNRLGENHSSYYICGSCGTIQVWPLPRLEELDRNVTYGPSPQPHQIVINNYKAERYKDYVRFLREVTGGIEGRVLEIGAASGAFLAMLRNETGADVLGIEPSKECQSMAKDNFGVKILPGTLESLDLETMGFKEKFDMVCSMNTLEHVRFPHRVLETMVMTVKPGGYLFLEVPSTEYLARHKSVVSGQDINPGHLSHFNGAGLASVLQALGTTVTHMRSSSDFNSPSLRIVAVKHSAAEINRTSFLKHIEQRNGWFLDRKRWFEDALADHRQVAIWGAGTDLFSVMVRYPDLVDAIQGCTLVDRNLVKQGKTIMGITIQPPEVLREDSHDLIVITAANYGLQMLICNDVQGLLPGVKYEYLFPQES